jgi:hypothetical protein
MEIKKRGSNLKKKHKKSNVNGRNWKTNKLNSKQLNDWGSLCNFARSVHILRWRGEKWEERGKTVFEAPSCHEGQHTLAHHVEGDEMLRMLLQKAIDDHRKASHALSKRRGYFSCTNYFFFNYRKTRIPLTPWNNCKNTKIKTPKMPLTLGGKKKPQELWGNKTV